MYANLNKEPCEKISQSKWLLVIIISMNKNWGQAIGDHADLSKAFDCIDDELLLVLIIITTIKT